MVRSLNAEPRGRSSFKKGFSMATVYKRGGKRGRGGSYYVAWTDHSGKRRSKRTGTSDKATAQRIGAKLDAEAAKRREGLIDADAETFAEQAALPLANHLLDFKAKMKAAGRTEGHVRRTIGMIKEIVEHCGFETTGDIGADKVNLFAAELLEKKVPRKAESGAAANAEQGGSSKPARTVAPRTVQARLAAIKSFTAWLVTRGRLSRDPLASVKKPNPNASRRRERRMLLPEEWPHLEQATAIGDPFYGIPGAERMLLYRVAIQTGLRSSELRSLRRESFVLDASQAYVIAKPADTKNSKQAQQFIARDMAESLRQHLAEKVPSAPAFSMPHETNVARMLRFDLTAARKAWIAEADQCPDERLSREQSDFLAVANHAGQRLDFHALRHTCGAWLAMTGSHPQTVKAVMRHSTITLTMDTYGHMFPGVEADSVDALASMFNPTTEEPSILRMTGTEYARPKPAKGGEVAAHLQRAGCDTVRSSAAGRKTESAETEEDSRRNPLAVATLGDAVRPGAAPCESSPGGTRTPDQGIMSPLL